MGYHLPRKGGGGGSSRDGRLGAEEGPGTHFAHKFGRRLNFWLLGLDAYPDYRSDHARDCLPRKGDRLKLWLTCNRLLECPPLNYRQRAPGGRERIVRRYRRKLSYAQAGEEEL